MFNHIYAYPAPLQTCPEVLLVFHRHGLIDNLQFLPAEAHHAAEISALDESKTLDFNQDTKTASFVAECQGTVIGALTLMELEATTDYEEDFDMREFYTDAGCCDTNVRLARANILVMNPIFLHR